MKSIHVHSAHLHFFMRWTMFILLVPAFWGGCADAPIASEQIAPAMIITRDRLVHAGRIPEQLSVIRSSIRYSSIPEFETGTIEVSPDDRWFALYETNWLFVFSAQTGKCVWSYGVKNARLLKAAFSDDAKRMTIILGSTTPGRPQTRCSTISWREEVASKSDEAVDFAVHSVSPNTRLLAFGIDYDAQAERYTKIGVWDRLSHSRIHTWRCGDGVPVDPWSQWTLSDDGRLLVKTSGIAKKAGGGHEMRPADSKVVYFSEESDAGQMVDIDIPGGGGVASVAFLKRRPMAVFGTNGRVRLLSFSKGGNGVAAIVNLNQQKIERVLDESSVHGEREFHERIAPFTVSCNDKHGAAAQGDIGTIWDLESGHIIARTDPSALKIRSATISRSGKVMIMIDDDENMFIWNRGF